MKSSCSFQKHGPPQRQVVGAGCKIAVLTTTDCITCFNESSVRNCIVLLFQIAQIAAFSRLHAVIMAPVLIASITVAV